MTEHRPDVPIVVVEDNRPIRRFVDFVLTQAGYRVASVDNAEQAIGVVQEFRPVLVLLDIDLRDGHNGFEVLERIRADDSVADTRVVAFTAYAMPGDKERFLDAGFDGYIPKPVVPDRFVKDVQQYLPRHVEQ